MDKKIRRPAGALTRRDLLRVLGSGAAAAAIPTLPKIARADSARADVVVVGAGFAGLTAARTLNRAGKNVIVLEARNRVGGRMSKRVRNGAPGLGGRRNGIACGARKRSRLH